MSGYANLASYYGALFPVSEACRRFLAPCASFCSTRQLPWLDVGCGVGNLVEWLRAEGVDAHGVEPDADFVAEARRRLDDEAGVRIRQGALNSALGMFDGVVWGGVSCLGNVLAHAASQDEIADFLSNCARAMAPGGVVVLQVVNYDKVLSAKEWTFPVLRRQAPDGMPLVFRRKYDLEGWKPGDRIVFETELDAGERTIWNQTRLLPLRRDDLVRLVRTVFERYRVFGDFSGVDWTPDGPATILIGG